MKNLVLFIIIMGRCVFAKDDFTINFIQSFIENEEKPTFVIMVNLCWGKNVEVNFVKQVSKLGVRASSSMAGNFEVQDHDLLFLVDLECPGGDIVLNNATSKNLFRFPLRWLVLSNADRVDISHSAIWDCPILVTSDLVLAERKGYQIIMTELHKPSLNYAMQLTPRGFYNGSLVDTRPQRTLYRRRRNLMREPLTMANVIQDNNDTRVHLLKEDRLDLHNDAVTKTCWTAAKHCFEMLNATRKYIFSYRWGYKVNGEWSGMINDIKTNKADLATNCIMYTERLEVVTFTDMVAPVRMRFIFRQPPLTYTANIFSLPFSSGVWAALVVCSAAVTFALFFTSTWEVRMERNPTQLDGSISDALLMTMSAVSQQGCFLEPRRAPGRIIEWFMFAALMALYAAYSANIVVLLQAPSNSIKTLTQLTSSKVMLGASDLDYSRFIFSKYNDSVHVAIKQRLMPEGTAPNFYTVDKGVAKIRQGLFAFHSIVEPVYRRVEETFLETEKCDLFEVDFVNGFDGFVPVKKDSPYLELIRVSFKQIRESGIQHALTRRLLASKPRCMSSVATFSSVGLLDMLPVLIFMLYGVAFSILIFFAEVLFYKGSYKLRNMRTKMEKCHEKKISFYK